MGLLGIVAGAISGVCSCIAGVCSAIGGTIAAAVSTLATGIANLCPHIIGVVIEVACKIAELLISKPKEESPEELAVKAEVAEKKPDDFDSIEEYINYLRTDVEVDKQKMEDVAADETTRLGYASVGIAFYIKAMEEKYGAGLEPEFWRAVGQSKMNPETAGKFISAVRELDVEAASLDGFFSGDLKGSERGAVYDALEVSLGENAEEGISVLREAYNDNEVNG